MSHCSPFWYFKTSPEVIRFGDDVSALPALSAECRGPAARTWDRGEPRDRPVLVAEVRAHVRRRDPEAASCGALSCRSTHEMGAADPQTLYRPNHSSRVQSLGAVKAVARL